MFYPITPNKSRHQVIRRCFFSFRPFQRLLEMPRCHGKVTTLPFQDKIVDPPRQRNYTDPTPFPVHLSRVTHGCCISIHNPLRFATDFTTNRGLFIAVSGSGPLLILCLFINQCLLGRDAAIANRAGRLHLSFRS